MRFSGIQLQSTIPESLESCTGVIGETKISKTYSWRTRQVLERQFELSHCTASIWKIAQRIQG